MSYAAAPMTRLRRAAPLEAVAARGWWLAVCCMLAGPACGGDATRGEARGPGVVGGERADSGGDMAGAAAADAGDDGDGGVADADGVAGPDALGAEVGDGGGGPASGMTIAAVTPAEGDTGGGNTVQITGTGLADVAEVYFGESPALEVLVHDDGRVDAVAPPRPAGLVDVTVRRYDGDGDAIEESIPFAYRYVATIAIHAVSPGQGDLRGGDLVTITGEGFDASTRFVFGDRLAIAPLVVDSAGATMHTPPGVAGRVDVIAAGLHGSATLSKGFEYLAKPSIALVQPAVVPLGGGKVRASGAGLRSDGAVVSLVRGGQSTLVAIVASASDGAWLDLALPAQSDGGAFDLRYSRPGATTTRAHAVVYASFVDAATGASQANAIAGVVPAVVPANLGATVELQLLGPIAGLLAAATTPGAVQVEVGGAAVPVLWHDVGAWSGPQPGATVRVQVPPLAAPWPEAKQGVLVSVAGQQAWLPGGLARSAPVPQVVAAAPPVLAPAGGTAISVQVQAAAAAGAVVGLRVGALWASGLSASTLGDGSVAIGAIAPAGSPGPATVQVVFAKGQAVWHGTLTYRGPPAVAAVVPARGSQAGQTLVKLVGDGLDALDRLFFGQGETKAIELVHPGLALVRTPAGAPGTVAVEGWFTAPGGGKEVAHLLQGFTYYDPQSGHAGTWGGPIDGNLDVTVLRTNMGPGPLEGALVVVEQPGKKPRTGLTDARGQVTIGALDLAGPLQVSASKPGYTAGSFVAVNARHLTLRLRMHETPPPSDGSGGATDEPAPYPDGAIEGVVLNASKYSALPMGNCANTPATGGNCLPCQDDLDCPGALTCETLLDPLAGFDLGAALPGAATATAPRACAAPCAAEADCPTGFSCRLTGFEPSGGGRMRCTPSVGTPKIRCRTSMPGLFGGNPEPGPAADTAADGTFRIDARLGDVAVACTAGYLAQGSSLFVPLMMGITRGVHVTTGQTTQGVKVVLDMPMRRTLDLELELLPTGPDTEGMERFATAVLDLGAEGYLPMGDLLTRATTRRLTLTRQPTTLKGANSSIAWTFYAGISQVGGGAPTAVAITERLEPSDAERLTLWPTGGAKPEAHAAYAPRLRALASDGAMVIGVGDGGTIAYWGGTSFTAQATPTGRDLRAIWLSPWATGEGWAGGDGGTLLRRDPVTGWYATVAPMPAPSTAELEESDRVVAITGLGDDDLWLLDGVNRVWRRTALGWQLAAAPLPQATKLPTSGWQAPPAQPRLRTLQRLGDGTLAACGEGGALYLAPATLPLAWQQVTTGTKWTLHSLWGVSAADLWVAGDGGLLGHVVQGKVTWTNSKTSEALYAVLGVDDGVYAVGARGSWVRVGLDGAVASAQVSDAAADLHALAAVPGGVLGAGVPVLRLGPFLELPYITEPAFGAPLGAQVQWKAAPGLLPTLQIVRVATADYTTRWELFVAGAVDSITLPDFQALGGFSPVPPGSLRVRVWRIFAPGLTVDAFQSKQLNVWQWVSYAYGFQTTSLTKATSSFSDKLPLPEIPAPP